MVADTGVRGTPIPLSLSLSVPNKARVSIRVLLSKQAACEPLLTCAKAEAPSMYMYLGEEMHLRRETVRGRKKE